MPSVRDARRERERGREPHEFAQRLFRGLPRRYDVLEDVLSLGQNRRWRREMLDHVVATNPAEILDVATGTAGVALDFVARSDGHVVGVDVTDAMLRRGQVNVGRAGVPDRVQFVLGTAERLPFPDATFDALTFTYLLRYVSDPRSTLRELARVLKPGAPMASLEFHVPPNPFWRFWWWLYTRGVLPAAGALAGRAWFEVGRFLGPNISAHYRDHPVPATLDAWRDAGMERVGARLMSLGGGVVMWGTRHG
ncbi:MAG TPA: class I SAM-dependent methyltransferase [Acidimicrobiia bacterium]|nr:class I SAM-dependent methyltransferase [Acidimicrobiia bacterium]